MTTDEKKPTALVATPKHHHAAPPRLVEALCPFEWVEGGYTLQACLQRPFQPKGLMLWDVPPHTQLLIFIGTNVELIASFGPIPARWFSAWESFQQVAAKIDQGLEPPAWGKFDFVHPGVMIRLRFDGFGTSRPPEGYEKIEAVMWGYMGVA